MRYALPTITLSTECILPSFESFKTEDGADKPLFVLQQTDRPPVLKEPLHAFQHRDICIERHNEGWLYKPSWSDRFALLKHHNADRFTMFCPSEEVHSFPQFLLSVALECASLPHGAISLHSACLDVDGQAVCFTAPSGLGKSTRARAWISASSAELISGDRPSIVISGNGVEACGVPWDGEEQLFRNVRRPLKLICEVRRAGFQGARRLSKAQARRLLMQQCFIPMWDPDTAATAMMLIRKLLDRVQIIRLFSGPDVDAAREAYELLFSHPKRIQEPAPEIAVKSGYTLRHCDGRTLLTSDNDPENAIALNDTAVFIWENLQNPISREDLLETLLAEYEIDRNTARSDINRLLTRFGEMGLLEPELA